jgi:hypothetical protein
MLIGFFQREVKMSDQIVGTMKEARILLPHRGNSVIQDWIQKGIVEASESKGTGKPFEFTFYQLLDLMVVDQLSLLGVFQKPYEGLNKIDPATNKGNVFEVFEDWGSDPSLWIDAQNLTRTRKNAIEFYKKYLCQVIITIYLKRVEPRPDKKTAGMKKGSRSKVGMLYYNITYFPEDPRLYSSQKGFVNRNDPCQIINEEVDAWRYGKMLDKGATLCMISVDLLRKHIQETLELYKEPVNYFETKREELERTTRRG